MESIKLGLNLNLEKLSNMPDWFKSLLIREFNSYFEEPYESIEPKNLLEERALPKIRESLASQFAMMRSEIDKGIEEAIEETRKEFPTMSEEKIREIVKGIKIEIRKEDF